MATDKISNAARLERAAGLEVVKFEEDSAIYDQLVFCLSVCLFVEPECRIRTIRQLWRDWWTQSKESQSMASADAAAFWVPRCFP